MINQIVLEINAFHDFNEWANTDKKTYKKIIALIHDVRRNPFTGLGKPEPLKHELKGYWSRRINDRDRLVYTIKDNQVIIISCKYHY